MAHKHSVYDTEPHFQIDKTSREIKNVSNSKTTITQFDHNSERFTFEIPRFIDGHDMSLCNNVQVHYINIDSTDKTNKIIGVYTVEDLQLSPEDEDIVICSWLISQNATQLAGSLAFLLRFACVTDDVLDYAWNTTKCTTISVSNGLYNGEAIIEEYFDILSVWEQNIIDDVTAGIDETIEEKVEEKVDNVKLVESASGKAITINPANAPIPYLKLSGETTQDGTPTPTELKELKSVGDSGSFNVNVYGDNLFDITTLTPRNSSQGGKVTFDGDIANISSSNQAWAICYAEKLKVEKDKSYTFSFEITNYSATTQTYITVRSEKGTEYGAFWFSENGKFEYSFTPTEDSLLIGVTSNGSGSNITNTYTMSKAQLEQGTQATPYKPCKKQKLTMPYTLRSVGEVKDEVDFARGVRTERFLYKRVTNVIDGYVGSNGYYIGVIAWNGKGVNNDIFANVLCNIAERTTTNGQYGNTSLPATVSISASNGVLICVKSITTKSDLDNYLANNEVYVLYELKQPIETPLTETELNAYRQLMTNSGTTTVLSECDVEMLYYVNKPNAQVIGDIHTQINKDYLKLHQAIFQSESQSEG